MLVSLILFLPPSNISPLPLSPCAHTGPMRQAATASHLTHTASPLTAAGWQAFTFHRRAPADGDGHRTCASAGRAATTIGFFPRRSVLENTLLWVSGGSDPWLSEYMRLAGSAPMIGADEESKLGTRAREGDQLAQARLVESNRGLVVEITKGYERPAPAVPLPELIRLGDEGLWKAARRFDPSKGFKFSTYATWWIRQAITRGLAEGEGGAGVREPRRPRPSSGPSFAIASAM
ncbi:MAG: hypothetical protein CYG61_05080 [Actinobacteria bacterium]|nr:MAG: hypothetical protein CYG61_05080 [Actinomycetota bacterium]